MGQGVHKEVISIGFESFSSIRIGIVELYGSCGTMEDAMKVFNEMPHRDVIVWNLMIHGFCEIVCARLEAVDIGQWIHSNAKSSGLYRDFISIGNSLVDFYCKCGILETAFTVFKDMP
ncbi:hypothetical protein ACSBR1_017835 [Camellia fascicularis]